MESSRSEPLSSRIGLQPFSIPSVDGAPRSWCPAPESPLVCHAEISIISALKPRPTECWELEASDLCGLHWISLSALFNPIPRMSTEVDSASLQPLPPAESTVTEVCL